jgi:hypothetical protein
VTCSASQRTYSSAQLSKSLHYSGSVLCLSAVSLQPAVCRLGQNPGKLVGGTHSAAGWASRE